MTVSAAVLCQCIGCGCDDNHACQDLLGDPCGWIVQSKSRRLGVCTRCPNMVPLWNARKRYFTKRAKAAIADRKLLDRLSKPRPRYFT